VIKVDLVAKIRQGSSFDIALASLVGGIAILATLLALVQASYSSQGARAQAMSARLASQVAAHGQANQLVNSFALGSTLRSLYLGVEATSRQLEGLDANQEAVVAIGAADQAASDRLTQAVADSAATGGASPPLDPYTASLVTQDLPQIKAIGDEQGRLVDAAGIAGDHGRVALLGLSLTALAGIFAGLSAVLRVGRAGWFTLGMGYAVGGLGVIALLVAVFGPFGQ
jgi:hypothetical protein